jgi:hypothetical protein
MLFLPVFSFAFQPTPWRRFKLDCQRRDPADLLLSSKKDVDDRDYWLGEFSTSTGEVVEPYKVLGGKYSDKKSVNSKSVR